jgi:hypothetical protein
MSAALPILMQDAGVPFDVFIQALTEQLDKAQASMAIKARVGKLSLTFAVKEVSLDLRAFVNLVDDDVYIRPAGPGESEASTVKLALTTITKPMIEENAMDFTPEDPKFSIREALGDKVNEDEQRRLERIGVRTVSQLAELRRTAGADVVARLARMPVNRLQQALLAASLPRLSRVEPSRSTPTPAPTRERDDFGLHGRSQPSPAANLAPGVRFLPRASLAPQAMAPQASAPVAAPVTTPAPVLMRMRSPQVLRSRLPRVLAAGMEVPVVEARDGELVLAPHASQMGCDAEVDFGDGEVARISLNDGSVGEWQGPTEGGAP